MGDVTEPIIKIQNFSYRYPRTPTPAIKDVSLEVEEGEFVGIVGPTGAGKTTLCLALHGFLPQILGGKAAGDILLAGRDAKTTEISELAFSSKEKSALIGMVFQDPESQLVGMSVEEDLAFGPENLGLPREEILARVKEVLEITRMEGFRDSFPYTLSGGEKQRTAIASVLTMRPRVLILDEPTSELDPIGRVEVFDVIARLKRESGLTIIVVEHNVEELVQHSDRLVALHEGKIVLDGPTREVISQTETLREIGVRPPEATELIRELESQGIINPDNVILGEHAAADYLSNLLKERAKNAARD